MAGLAESTETALRALVDTVEDDPSPYLRIAALERLADHENADALATARIMAVEDPVPWVRTREVQVLGAHGDTSTLEEVAHTDDRADVRAAATRLLEAERKSD